MLTPAVRIVPLVQGVATVIFHAVGRDLFFHPKPPEMTVLRAIHIPEAGMLYRLAGRI
jgi:hypothetical protein